MARPRPKRPPNPLSLGARMKLIAIAENLAKVKL